ncbi:MAG TPA: ABC transporter permease, partial [Acidimicrobiia bacterium]|nr:ABC transporter permease [Acidimicrobiia bacterium]
MSASRSSTLRLWLRWSWRDLRRRWLLVAAIAVIIAIGTGTFAGLGSTATWRRLSNDASYAALRMHDLRVELSEGSYVAEGRLREVVASLPSAEVVVGVEERLFVDTQVDASQGDDTVLVPGELIGVALDRDLEVDALHVAEGGAPGVATGAAVLEQKFAAHYDLPTAGTIVVGGGHELAYTGVGVSPELFLVTDQAAGVFGQSNFAAVFVTLADAQRLGGHDGQVNDLVLRLAPGTDRDRIQAELEAALVGALPDVGATVTTRDDDQAYRVLYDDIDNDQQLWNLFAIVILLAASFAAFNLISRIVDAERREIGVGMALGARPRRLAVRPMLVGAQVAALGVVLGVGIGLLLGAAMRSLLIEFLPLPEWRTPFQLGVYVRAAALGLALPVVATAIPVWRAVRVEPVDAIRTGPHSARAQRSGLAPLLARLPLGRRTLVQMPFRETLRAPRRTLLTVLGI